MKGMQHEIGLARMSFDRREPYQPPAQGAGRLYGEQHRWRLLLKSLYPALCSGGGFLALTGRSLRPAAFNQVCARLIRTALSFGSVQFLTQSIASSAQSRNSLAFDMTCSRLTGMSCKPTPPPAEGHHLSMSGQSLTKTAQVSKLAP